MLSSKHAKTIYVVQLIDRTRLLEVGSDFSDISLIKKKKIEKVNMKIIIKSMLKFTTHPQLKKNSLTSLNNKIFNKCVNTIYFVNIIELYELSSRSLMFKQGIEICVVYSLILNVCSRQSTNNRLSISLYCQVQKRLHHVILVNIRLLWLMFS